MSEILSSETIEKMRKFNNNSKWLSAHYEDIKHRYTNKIVAIDNDTVIDYDVDINSLLKRLRERYTNIHHIVIQYINDKEYPITQLKLRTKLYLTGFFNKFYGYCISAKIFFIDLGKEQQILFKIDNGCDITTISFIDSLMLNLDYDGLQNIETLTAGGELANSILVNNCALGFIVNNESIHFEILNNIHISRPVLNPANINYNKKLGLHLSLPSLLGLDVLRRYKVSYVNNVVYLEK